MKLDTQSHLEYNEHVVYIPDKDKDDGRCDIRHENHSLVNGIVIDPKDEVCLSGQRSAAESPRRICCCVCILAVSLAVYRFVEVAPP